MRSVADHAQVVSNAEKFVESVRDVDDRRPFRFDLSDLGEENFDLLGRDGGGRLIHDDDIGLLGDRLHDLEHLDVGDRQILELGPRIVGEAFGSEQGLRALADLRPTDFAKAAHRLDAKEQCLFDRDFRNVIEFLRDHRDPERPRFDRAFDMNVPAIDPDLAGIGLVEAVDNFHERRFASAVLAANDMHCRSAEPNAHVG
jgi:hypothetical protein